MLIPDSMAIFVKLIYHCISDLLSGHIASSSSEESEQSGNPSHRLLRSTQVVPSLQAKSVSELQTTLVPLKENVQ